jgi:DNA-binding transcriptional regulator YiaG
MAQNRKQKTVSQRRRKAVRKVECTNCGATARVVRGSYDFAESGLKRVRLQGIELIVCDQCGNVDPIIPRVNDLMRLLAIAVIAKPYRLAGDEIRFLRKYLRMTGDEFGRLLHINRTNLSKWENDEDRVGAQSDRLVRAIALSLGDGLRGKLEEVIRKFPEIRDEPAAMRIDMDTEKMSYQYVEGA